MVSGVVESIVNIFRGFSDVIDVSAEKRGSNSELIYIILEKNYRLFFDVNVCNFFTSLSGSALFFYVLFFHL